MSRNSVMLLRLIISYRRLWIPIMVVLGLWFVAPLLRPANDDRGVKIEQALPIPNAPSFRHFPRRLLSSASSLSSNRLTFDEVPSLLDQLFDSSTTLVSLQQTWNRLIEIWHSILSKFVQDACELCHMNRSDCYDSVDTKRYIYLINESFFPINETKRPQGMGLYHYFNLQSARSMNNSILPTDVTPCDYFHMMQLMINVQLVLHQAQIKYFLTKGTLIGALRHHDVIPWDTDIDIFIPTYAIRKLQLSFKQLNVASTSVSTSTSASTTRAPKDRPSYQQDLVVYRFKNVYRVTSYKIFSLRSPLVNRTNYRWPKIDIFPYEENATHIYAFPKHRHNLGTMSYLLKNNVEPVYLRPLGPLLVPSPHHPRASMKAMIKLGRSSVFFVCEGNSFLHRENRGPTESWRVPCLELHRSYPFVKSEYNPIVGLCSETLLFYEQNQSYSSFKFKCDEHFERTLI